MILSCVAERTAKLQWILRRELRISDGLVRRLKPKNAFSVNGEPSHTNRIVHPGDRVTAVIEEEAPDFPAQDGPLTIVYEDESVILLDKPAGVIVHPTFTREEGTLANYLLGYYQKTGQRCAVHVLTRLDRDTMGLVLYAKNAWVHALLMDAQAAGDVKKTYLARTRGWIDREQGRIEAPIARLAPGSLLRCVRADGKKAITEYAVVNRTSPEDVSLELCPVTGRTHQLRVHCAYLGHPILGDPQYGGGEGGQRLVCKRLRFRHPVTNEPMEFESGFTP